MDDLTPQDIRLHQKSRRLEITFPDENTFNYSCEYLRVYSPSAEVRGHRPGEEVLQVDKEGVNIIAIEPVGNYAIKLYFDDGHNSGIYDWRLLYNLGKHQEEFWQDYLQRLKAAGRSHSQLRN